MDSREHVDLGAQRGQRVIGQLDSVRQQCGIEPKLLLGGIAIRDDGSDGDRAQVDCLAVFRPNNRSIACGIAGFLPSLQQREGHT